MLYHAREGWPLTTEPEYASQLGHTIWELERAVKSGRRGEGVRRALVEAHVEHLRYLEERSEVPRQQRSVAFLQPRVGDAVLFLPGEGAGADEVERLAEAFAARGFSTLTSALAHRTLDHPGRSPQYWQTIADEAETRFEILAHYANRMVVVGVGLSASVAVHLASRRRIDAVIALYPALHAAPGWWARFRRSLQRLLHREAEVPHGWAAQRELVATEARVAAARITTPIFLLVEERRDRSDAARSAQVAQKLERATVRVRTLPPRGAVPGPLELPADVVDEIVKFARG